MAGLFRDPSDANRKSRGARPFAGQTHQPGSGPIKGNPVRRPTVAPFESPFAERKRPSPLIQAASPPPEPAIVDETPLALPDIEAGMAHEELSISQRSDIPPEPMHGTLEPSEVQLAPAPEDFEPTGSALRTEDLFDIASLDGVSDDVSPVTEEVDAVQETGAADDWFSDARHGTRDEDVSEAPFENIESLEAPLSAWEPPVASEPPEPQLPLSADWAVSHDGEADLHAYVAASRAREHASETLEAVARRVRSGEIVVALEPGATTEAVLASVLASLLAYPT